MDINNEYFVVFGLYKYLVIALGLTDVPATFHGKIYEILLPFLGMEWVINTNMEIHQDNGMVVKACIDGIWISP